MGNVIVSSFSRALLTFARLLLLLGSLCHIRLRPVLSADDGNPPLADLRCISMPWHARRATASPLILRLWLRLKLPVRISVPDRTSLGALLLRTAVSCSASGASSVTFANVGYRYKWRGETGVTRCLAAKSMHFIDRCIQSLLHGAVYWQWLIRYTILLLPAVYRIKNDYTLTSIDNYFAWNNLRFETCRGK